MQSDAGPSIPERRERDLGRPRPHCMSARGTCRGPGQPADGGVRASRCAAPAGRRRRRPAPGSTFATTGRSARKAAAESNSASCSSDTTVGRQHPHLTGRVPVQQVARTHPRAVVGLRGRAGGLLVGRHPGGEDPRVVAARLELRRHPVRPAAQVGHREPHPALLLDLAHGGRGVRSGHLEASHPHGGSELGQPRRRQRQGLVGRVDPTTGEHHGRRRERHRRHPPLHVDLRARRAVAHEHHRRGGPGLDDHRGRPTPATAAPAPPTRGHARSGGRRRDPTHRHPARPARTPRPRPPRTPHPAARDVSPARGR